MSVGQPDPWIFFAALWTADPSIPSSITGWGFSAVSGVKCLGQQAAHLDASLSGP